MHKKMLDVVIPAAGVGSRMGSSIPKQYLKIQNKEIIVHTVSVFLEHPCVGKIIIALSENDSFFDKLEISTNERVIKAIGGMERAQSVLSGLYKCTTEYVMVHDAARPMVCTDDITSLIEKCTHDGCIGGILCSPVSDTLKLEKDSYIEKTVDRAHMFRAFTPQLFKTKELIAALLKGAQRGLNITDEASAMEAAGFSVKLINGRSDNFKITTADDLYLARALFDYRSKQCE